MAPAHVRAPDPPGRSGGSVTPKPDEAFYEESRRLLEGPYLDAEDPRGGSGFRGDGARWEMARRPISSAINRDGTFLDIGCANGLLMQSIERWAGEDGYEIEAHGLDMIPTLATLARQRLPKHADRIHTGNLMDWPPPIRYDFVNTNLEYVPEHRRAEMVARLLTDFVAPGGRVIVCSYGSSRRPEPRTENIGDILRSYGYDVAGQSEAVETNGVVITRVAWVDAPEYVDFCCH